MADMNLKTIKATYKSYIQALERLTKRGFTDLARRGSGYTHYLGEEYSCSNGRREEADYCYVRIDSLMEYGKPKHIEKSYWVYKSSFVNLGFSAHENFDTSYLSFDYDKEEHKQIIKTSQHKLSIGFGEIGIGIGYWNDEKKNELRELAAKCKPIVSEQILKAINDADIELNAWRAARKKLLSDEFAE